LIKIFLALFFVFFVSLYAQDSSEEIQTKELEKTIQVKEFIAVSEVSEKSVETLEVLKEISEAIKPTEKISEIHESIPSYLSSIDHILNDSQYQNLEALNIRKLQKLQSELLIYIASLNEWKNILKLKIEIYNENRTLLKKSAELWDETKLNAVKENAPQAIQEQILSIISHLKELEDVSKKNYDNTLTDLNSITTKIVKIDNMTDSLKKAEMKSSNDIFSQNSLPLFDFFSTQSLSPVNFVLGVKSSFIERYKESINYFQTKLSRWYLFLILSILIILLVAYFNYLHSKKRLFVKESSLHKKDFYFMRMPIATIVILVALAVVIIFPDYPASVMQYLLLFLILPVARIIQTFIQKEQRKFLYIFLALYALNIFDSNAVTNSFEARLFSLTLSLGLLYFILVLIQKSLLESAVNKYIKPFASKLFILFTALLTIAILSNIYGGVLLSSRILNGVFITIYSALIFYTIYIVLSGYIIIIFRRRVDTTSNVMELYSQKIEHTTIVIIKIVMFLWWIKVVLETLSLYPFVLEYNDMFMELSWKISSTVITVKAIVNFIAIVIGTWMVSKLVITVLNVEVFARFSFPRGVPTAITTTLNYIIVISGTIIALSSLGVTPEQFTLVFGALGVGIGFGLRNIIANFVSGIIMVFERPVQIGDTIEVNSTLGSVQSIGARSTTIKTFDGSEVIIPNADFIAKDITNWTLSDEYRRKLVVFKVDYDSDVEEVLSIMHDVAVSHKDVLKDPEPLATFKGFGENYLEFKLYFWLTDNLIVAPSEVSIGIYKALKEAGIKMPMPKQETYLKKVEE